MGFNFVFQLKAVMELQNIISALMTVAVLPGPLVGTEVTAKSRWIDLVSGITLKSKDIIGKLWNSSL
jgi:hypothetical protein